MGGGRLSGIVCELMLPPRCLFFLSRLSVDREGLVFALHRRFELDVVRLYTSEGLLVGCFCPSRPSPDKFCSLPVYQTKVT